MPPAPNRGPRKCATCIFYTDKEAEWRGGCQLPICECATRNVAAGKSENWGTASCKHKKPTTFLDTSDHHDIGGYPTGYCEWKCPPVMRRLLRDQWGYRLVNKDGSWCHCWEPIPAGPELDEHLALPNTKAIKIAAPRK